MHLIIFINLGFVCYSPTCVDSQIPMLTTLHNVNIIQYSMHTYTHNFVNKHNTCSNRMLHMPVCLHEDDMHNVVQIWTQIVPCLL